MQLIRPDNRTSSRSRRRLSRAGTRRGLAPVELVLALPFLLVIMCLMINIGTEVKWKIRALEASRQAVWRVRNDRRGATDPQLPNWPSTATLSVQAAPAPPLIAEDPFAAHAVVRGQPLRDPQASGAGSQLFVDTSLLDSLKEVRQGVAQIDRSFPVLPQIGGVHLRTTHLLLEGMWRFQEMGYSTNNSRRIFRLYQFVPPQGLSELAQEYQQAAMAILNAPFRQDLAPLDNDDELAAYFGSPPPDFHPQIDWRSMCSLNRFAVRADEVQRLIVRIQGPRGGGRGGVPSVMASTFLSMYQSQMQELQNQNPPPQTQIDQLQQKIDQLRKFQGTLR